MPVLIDKIADDKYHLSLAKGEVDIGPDGGLVNIWGGKSSVGLVLPFARTAPQLDKDKVVYSTPEKDVIFYADDPLLEYELVLKANPGVSELVLPFNMKNLQAHYQGELDAQAKAEGHIRLPEMVGGYALYHGTRMAFTRSGIGGQAGLLQRITARRADGRELVLPMVLTPTGLILTLDPSFFAGPYPITIDPTLGLHTQGGTTDTSGEHRIKGSWDTTDGSGGVVTTLYAWIRTTTAAKKFKLAVYSYNGVADAVDLLDYNLEQSVNPNGAAQYSGAAQVGYTLAASTEYFLLAFGEGGLAGELDFYYNSVSNKGIYVTVTYNGWPDPLTGESGVGRQYSVSCDVGEEGPVEKALAGGLSFSGVASRKIFLVKSGAFTPSGSLNLKSKIGLAGSLTSSGALASVLTKFKSLAGSLTSAGAVGKKTKIALSGALTSAGALGVKVKKALSGALTSSGALAGNLLGAFYLVGTLGIKVKVALSGTLGSSGVMSFKAKKTLSGALASSGMIGRKIKLSLSGALASSGALGRKIKITLTGVLYSVAEVLAPTDNLISWWKLNQDGNDAYSSNHGTVYGATPKPSCYSFDGDNDYIDIPYAAELDVSTEKLTIEAWIYPRDRVRGGIVSHMDRGTPVNGWWMTYSVGGVVNVASVDAGSWKYTAGYTIPVLNRWYHLVATVDASDLKFYVDGQLVDTEPNDNANAVPTNGLGIHIGRDYLSGSTYYFNGNVDEVRVYDDVLSPADVLNRYNWTRQPMAGALGIKVKLTLSGALATAGSLSSTLRRWVLSRMKVLLFGKSRTTLDIGSKASMDTELDSKADIDVSLLGGG